MKRSVQTAVAKTVPFQTTIPNELAEFLEAQAKQAGVPVEEIVNAILAMKVEQAGRKEMEDAALVLGKAPSHIVNVAWELPNDAICYAGRLAHLRGCSLSEAVACVLDGDTYENFYGNIQDEIAEMEKIEAQLQAEQAA